MHECLDIITKTLMLPVAAPSWAWKLPFEWSVCPETMMKQVLFSDNHCRMQRTRRAYDTMRVFVRSQVNTIRETIRSEVANGEVKPGKDLFSLLIHASEDEGGKRGLSDDELVSRLLALLFCHRSARKYGR
jgi:cytochrome P450